MNNMTFIEEEVVRMLLAGEDETLSLLRDQARQADVSSRKFTGVGFFTHFSIPSDVPRLPGGSNFELDDVRGTGANTAHGVGFLLFIRDGALSFLEGFTYGEPWPKDTAGLKLEYSGGGSRDMEKLRKDLHKTPQ